MPKKKIKDKGTLFCFTDFSKINLERGYKGYFEEWKDQIRGIAWGKEICPKTFAKTGVEKYHNQGFIQLYSQNSFVKIQKWFKSKCHFEVCEGTVEDNVNYCSKEGFYTTVGTFVTQGYRTDLHNIKDDLKGGASEYDIMENYTGQYVRYHSGIAKMKALIEKNKVLKAGWREVQVTALIGASRTGKSSYVYKKYGYENVFKIDAKADPKFMFDGYAQEDTILIEEFDGYIDYGYMLSILDGHPLPMNIKGGKTYGRFSNVYITSNEKPIYWYKSIAENLKNRLTTILEVTVGNTGTTVTKPMINAWVKDWDHACQYGEESSDDE